jgi:hypothetical protein
VTVGADNSGRRVGKMTYLAVTLLGWSVWALCVVLLALTALLDHYYTPPFPNKGNDNFYTFFGVPLLVYATVGAFVASRRPRNLIGWLLCVIGFVLALVSFSVAYADYVVGHPGSSLPVGVYMACIAQSLVALPVLILCVTLLILLFPDGRLPDRSLRAVPWIVVVGGATSTLWALTSERVFGRYSLRNPLHLEGALGDAVEGFGRLGASVILVGFVIAIIAVFVRLGSAQGAERQQLKWFAYAAAVLLGITFLAPGVAWFLPGWLSFPLGIVVFSAIPVAVGIAVLKYRLYDIDRIINRTLVYVSLTAILAGIYFGGVTATQALMPTLTGQERLPQLVVVASTLVIAALFNPLRRRIQRFIDRSFYRRKYDARKTLEEFSTKLRDETDLEALNEDLVGVVRNTMQPAHVSLWLRPFDDMGRRKELPG